LTQLKKLRDSKSIQGVANLLGYKPKHLAYILYKLPPEEKYKEFEIPKKNGDLRKIHAPTEKLKKLQKHLAHLLYQCVDESKPKGEKLKDIKGSKPIRNRAKRSIAHGFHQGLSIASNAEEHIKKRYVFNIDIENFFPSINFGRVRGYFIKNHKFRLSPKVATILAQIACHNNELPQGSPCSPVISNLLAETLDRHMLKLSIKHKCTYTRYADDLTFSTNQKTFPKKIAYKSIISKNKWSAGRSLVESITHSGFKINKRKTRMQYRNSRQEVTGLVVNKVVNTKSDYYRRARSMCNSLFNKGYFSLPNKARIKKVSFFDKISQNISNRYKLMFKKTENLQSTSSEKSNDIDSKPTIKQLEGILSHIYYIKNYRNKYAQQGYRKSRHDGIIAPDHSATNKKYPPLNRTNNYEDESHKIAIDGIKNLYQKFLFFKLFYFLEKPLILCEGKTDNIYLQCAIKNLAKSHPSLIEVVEKKPIYNIDFFNRTRTTSEMLKLAEGAGGMKYLIMVYKRFFKAYRCEGKKHPVIMIVDNDEAGKGVIKASRAQSSNNKNKLPLITENLYILALPKVNNVDTEMEDYFEGSVLAKTLNGKTFNRSNGKLDKNKEYGKDYFSKFVVKKEQETINFNEFEPLLSEISSIIDNYKTSNT